MRKLDKIETICLFYLMLVVLSYSVGTNSQLWNSFYFIREHSYIIVLLLFLKDKFLSVFSILLKWGIIVFKVEMIIYNIFLIFVTEKEAEKYNNCYDIVLILTASIFIVIFIAKFLDKILIIFNKFRKWINK
jgi:hypothetical protein